MVVGPDDQIMKIVTPCPESPGQWPEYPGVTGKAAKAGERTEEKMTCRLTGGSADDVVG